MRQTCLTALALASILAPAASASEVHVETQSGERVLVFAAASGEVNFVSIGRSEGRAGGPIFVQDYGRTEQPTALRKGPGCQPGESPQTTAMCDGDVAAAQIYLGDREDTGSIFQLDSVAVSLFGQGGTDDISFLAPPSGSGPVRLDGGEGGDFLTGSAGGQVLLGGPGDDALLGGGGADLISGGSGVDVALYYTSLFGQPVPSARVVLDGRGPDGVPGERDRLAADVEDLASGGGNDELRGNAGPNAISGNDGNDSLTGGGGRDVLAGGDGDDRLNARDGRRDLVGCGLGDRDVALVDPHDDVGVECERVVVRRARRR